MINPITPLVTLAMRIEINEFTAVFPSNSVHSNKFPFLRTGMMALACALIRVAPSAMISKPTGSSDIRPRVRPLNNAESMMRETPRMSEAVAGRKGSAATSHPELVKQSCAHDAMVEAPHAVTHASRALMAPERGERVCERARPGAAVRGDGRERARRSVGMTRELGSAGGKIGSRPRARTRVPRERQKEKECVSSMRVLKIE